MFYYIIGFIFILWFISYLYMFGKALLLNKQNTVIQFLSGYVAYSALIGIGGIPIQFFKLPWMLFFVYMILIITVTSVFIFLRIKKHKLKFFEEGWLCFLRNHWFLFVVAGILVLIALTGVFELWQNNKSDDGFYLTKIATIPYISNPFSTIPASGLPTGYQVFDAYVFNTWELEASVFVYLLKIPASLFTRFFMSGFNYFLFGCTIYALAKKIFDKLNITVSSRQVQYVVVIIILFSFSPAFLYMSTPIFNMEMPDSWQFVTAMYYGSAMVRTSGVLLLLLPLIGLKKITYKEVLTTAIIAFVLLTKSTIAVPIVFVISAAYLIIHFISHEKKYIKFAVVGIVLLAGASIILGNNAQIEFLVSKNFNFNICRDILFVSVILIILSMLVFRQKYIFRINMMLIMTYALVLWNPLNNVFETMSVYDFVAIRSLAAILYLTVILATVYFFAIVFKFSKRHNLIVDVFVAVLTVTLTCGSLYAMNTTYGEVKHSYATMWNNKMLVPNSTIELGKKLDIISNSTDQKINVVMPAGLHIDDGIPHFPSAIIRCYAPKIVSVTAILRFLGGQGTPLEGYSLDDQTVADNFSVDPNEKNHEAFKELLNKYPTINCFVFTTDRAKDKLAMLNFENVVSVTDQKAGIIYYVYLSNSINVNNIFN